MDTIAQKFEIRTADGSFEKFYSMTLQEVEALVREVEPYPGYVLSVEPTSVVRVPRHYLREGF